MMTHPHVMVDIRYRRLLKPPPMMDDTPLAFLCGDGSWELAAWNGEKYVPECEYPPFEEVETICYGECGR